MITTPTTASSTPLAAGPDLAAVKRRQQQAWSSGDYAAVAARIVLIAERLADAADLPAGGTVLDVATGTGNAALAAARSGCTVTGVDYVPELLAHGRERARVEGLPVDFVEGDAENLPVPDAAFDAVLSCLGVMFTPDQERAAAELVRACRPGGTIALANWTPSGFIGQVLATVGKYVPPPAGVRSPVLWGTPERVGDLLGGSVSQLSVRSRSFVFRFASPQDFADVFGTKYGPIRRATDLIEPDAGRALRADLIALATAHDRGPGGGRTSIPSEYLEVTAVRN